MLSIQRGYIIIEYLELHDAYTDGKRRFMEEVTLLLKALLCVRDATETEDCRMSRFLRIVRSIREEVMTRIRESRSMQTEEWWGLELVRGESQPPDDSAPLNYNLTILGKAGIRAVRRSSLKPRYIPRCFVVAT